MVRVSNLHLSRNTGNSGWKKQPSWVASMAASEKGDKNMRLREWQKWVTCTQRLSYILLIFIAHSMVDNLCILFQLMKLKTMYVRSCSLYEIWSSLFSDLLFNDWIALSASVNNTHNKIRATEFGKKYVLSLGTVLRT